VAFLFLAGLSPQSQFPGLHDKHCFLHGRNLVARGLRINGPPLLITLPDRSTAISVSYLLRPHASALATFLLVYLAAQAGKHRQTTRQYEHND